MTVEDGLFVVPGFGSERPMQPAGTGGSSVRMLGWSPFTSCERPSEPKGCMARCPLELPFHPKEDPEVGIHDVLFGNFVSSSLSTAFEAILTARGATASEVWIHAGIPWQRTGRDRRIQRTFSVGKISRLTSASAGCQMDSSKWRAGGESLPFRMGCPPH